MTYVGGLPAIPLFAAGGAVLWGACDGDEDGGSDGSKTIAEGCDAGACIVGESVDVCGIEVDGAADCVIACGAVFWDAVVVATVVLASEVAVCCRLGP